ncbi:hypothetical protein F5887DRAFT_879050 [Amanita rubescens]|nr:hypothetical protein F5887DRAFT_879050 [Amanita rubescens]
MSDSHPHSSKKRTALQSIFYGWRTVLFGSWLNLLLVLLPIAWAASVSMKDSHDLVFALCTLALIPLVKLHDLSTTDLAIRMGGTNAGLVNATVTESVEIVVAISALRKCELQIVQSTMVGAILSKLLLILGLCFFAGGLRFSEQGFDATATQIQSSLLNISVGAVLIPVAYHFALKNVAHDSPAEQARDILHMSHGVSIVLLIIYIAYLLFQFWSHTHFYHDNHNKKSNRLSIRLPIETPRMFRPTNRSASPRPSNMEKSDSTESSPVSLSFPRPLYLSPQASMSDLTLAKSDPDFGVPLQRYDSIQSEFSSVRNRASLASEGDSNSPRTTKSAKKEPRLSWQLTCILLIVVTIAVAVTAEWLIGSLNGISTKISKPWFGLILLPVVSSIAECITAVNVSVKDQLTLSISVAIGSALQTALFCIPSLVILAWIIDKPLSLLMDPFQSLVLYLSVQTTGHVIADGRSNWLEGMILICVYAIVGVAFWFYPGELSSLTFIPF